MNLHRSKGASDYEGLPYDELNCHQKLGRKSNGILTLANVVSLAGLVISSSGIKDCYQGNYKKGVAKIASGRLLDILDGFVADKTKTKSELGARLDAGTDKILMAEALIGLGSKQILSNIVVASFATQNGANVLSTYLYLKNHNNKDPQSSREGKLTTTFQWLTIGGFVVNELLEDQGRNKSSTLEVINWTNFVISNVIGTKASLNYFHDATQSINVTSSEN